MKVCILGGGVGGLSAAHELSKHEHITIELFDRNETLGGQARSIVEDGEPSEYCWHAVSSGYANLPQVMSEIPVEQDKTVIDHLKPFRHYNFITKNKNISQYDKNFLTNPSMFPSTMKQLYGKYFVTDMFRAFWLFIRAKTMCPERLEEMGNVYWKDTCKNLSPEMKRWAIDSTSIYLGMDYNNIDSQLIFDLLRHNQKCKELDEKYDFYSFDGPIDQVWFEPWYDLLVKRQVQMHLRHEILDIVMNGDKIDHVRVLDLYANTERKVYADIFINGLGVETLGRLYPLDSDFPLLAKLGYQLQTQVLFKIPRLNEDLPTAFIFHETPWFLMARHEGSFWDLEDKDYLSVGIGIWDQKGLNGKTAKECTLYELAQECWNQMIEMDIMLPKELPHWDVWKGYEFSKLHNRLQTVEPKFSNNLGTLALRPEIKDKHIPNLYHATSYVRTDTNIFNMDSGCEAGLKVARDILGQDKVIVNSPTKFGWFLRLVHKIDRFFFKRFRC